MNPTDWGEADAILTRNGKPVATRKIANNTHLQRRPGCCDPRVKECIAVKLHDTDIVTFHRHEDIELNTGGWLTVTTKERMNRYLPSPLKVESIRGRWHIFLRNGIDNIPVRRPFHDGIRLYQEQIMLSGNAYVSAPKRQGIWLIRNPLSEADEQANERHNARMDQLINDYFKKVRDRYRDSSHQWHPPTYPSQVTGDCAMCVRTGVGTLVGDSFEDKQHLIDHLLEQTIPWSIWLIASEQANPSGMRLHLMDCAISDLRRWLRDQLYVGAVSFGHGKRPPHTNRQAIGGLGK